MLGFHSRNHIEKHFLKHKEERSIQLLEQKEAHEIHFLGRNTQKKQSRKSLKRIEEGKSQRKHDRNCRCLVVGEA